MNSNSNSSNSNNNNNSRSTIILVDDNITNLNIGRSLLSNDYNAITVPSAEKLFKILEKITPDLILLDIEMPEMNGYEAIKILKSNDDTKNIPVFFLTAKNDTGSEFEGLSLGAVDYITKPFSPPLLLKRIEMHLLVESQNRELQHYNDNLQEMVREKTRLVIELQNAILKTMAELVEYRDTITGGHIERTQAYLKILIDAILTDERYAKEVASWDLDFLIPSSQLHDVGKIAISDNILKKPGRLTSSEFDEMKRHTTFGVEVIRKIAENTSESSFLHYAEIFAATHHERWDGTGYPYRISGENIPLEGRLMAIIDVYDALTNERPYKRAFSHGDAVNIIKDESGTHFDPHLVDVFLKNQNKFESICNQAIPTDSSNGAGDKDD